MASHLERVELPDGDFVDLAWFAPPEPASRQPTRVVMVMPGLNGSAQSPYVLGVIREILARGWYGLIFQYRGTSGEPNRTAQAYHAGATADPRIIVGKLISGELAYVPPGPLQIAAVGFSLGGSVLLNMLAEDGADTPLAGVAVASVPLHLPSCIDRLEHGFSWVYNYYLLAELIRQFRVRKAAMPSLFRDVRLRGVRSLRDFDDRVTAPLHGFAGASAYYEACSSLPKLDDVKRPVLIVQADNDPFLDPSSHRRKSWPDDVTVEVAEDGGHVGFVEGPHPWAARYYLEYRLVQFLENRVFLRAGHPHLMVSE